MGASAAYRLYIKILERILNTKAPFKLFMREEQFRLEGPGSIGDALLGFRSGDLSKSFAKGGPGSIFKIKIGNGGINIEWGTNIEYATKWEGPEAIVEKPFVSPAMDLFFKKDVPGLVQEAFKEFEKQFEELVFDR